MLQSFICVSMTMIGLAAVAGAQQRPIDTAKSVLTVHVAKSGAFSAFGHNHQIGAPIASGSVDTSAHKVELRVNAAALKVKDPDVSDKDRAEIQKTMLGPDVLDTEQHHEIVFRSTTAERLDNGGWRINGNLTLHGETRPIVVEVKEQEGRYVGSSHFRQTEFGIKPVKIAGGTIRVKDEVRIEFDIQLAH